MSVCLSVCLIDDGAAAVEQHSGDETWCDGAHGTPETDGFETTCGWIRDVDMVSGAQSTTMFGPAGPPPPPQDVQARELRL